MTTTSTIKYIEKTTGRTGGEAFRLHLTGAKRPKSFLTLGEAMDAAAKLGASGRWESVREGRSTYYTDKAGK